MKVLHPLLFFLAITSLAQTPTLYYTLEEGSGTNITNLGSVPGDGILVGNGTDARWIAGAPDGGTPIGGLDLDG